MNDFDRGKLWQPPDYVNDDEDVWLVLSRHPSNLTKVRKCKVAVAAGKHARIVGSDVDRWVSLDGGLLLVPPEDMRHPNNRANRDQAIIEALNAPSSG